MAVTNIIYANPGPQVIEVHPTHDTSTQGSEFVWWLSSAMDLNYWVVPTPFKLSDHSIVFPLEPIKAVLEKIKAQI